MQSNQAVSMEYDELSGRTIQQPGPWKEILNARRRAKHPDYTSVVAPSQGKPTSPPRASPAPRLPESDYKIIYRPRDGLRLASWSDRQIAAGLQAASGIPEGIFNHQVIIQVQAIQNLVVASTPNEDCAEALHHVTTLQLGAVTYKVLSYFKHFPGTVKGVIHGLDPGTTTEQLPYILASTGPRIVQARMLGQSSSAVVTFEGPHVPFYIRAHGLYTRCRPYRRSVQCCMLCGDIGHRRDVCPTPEATVCAQCHERDPAPEHACAPKCKLCGLEHLTASKECRKKLRPPPPPLHVRERLARSAVTYQRQPQQQPSAQQLHHQNVQENAQRQHQPPPHVSWSSIAANPVRVPEDFPPLPEQQAPTADNLRMQQLEKENEQLRKQLELQAARTEKLEQRIEELLNHLDTIKKVPAQHVAPTATTLEVTQRPPSVPTPTQMDISRLETLISDLGSKIERRIAAIERRQEAAEEVKRKNRRKRGDSSTNNPPSRMTTDDEWEPCQSGEP